MPRKYKEAIPNVKPVSMINFKSTTKSYNRQFGEIQDTTIIPENITYTLPKRTNYNDFSYKNIRVTNHARDKALTRIGTSSEKEIQKMAASAKKNGLNMNSLSMMNYESFGLSFEEYKWLKDKVFFNKDTESAFFYKGRFFIFAGTKNRSLKTIIYPGAIIEDEKTSGDDIVNKFFADVDRNRMHNITVPTRKINRPQ